MFSLSDIDMTTARDFIDWLIELCVTHDIPTNDTLLNLCEDVSRYMYSCVFHRRCCICGKKADIHEVEKVGMGRNRTKIHHLNQAVQPLCRSHHMEEENLGQKAFDEKYHLQFIRLDTNLCKKLNITLLLENLRMIGSMIFLLEKIKSHNLSVCLDFGHANVWCYSPMDLIKKYKNRIQGVHMHDNNGEVGNDQHLIPFQGKINWEKCVKALYKYYDGPISLEIDNFKTEEYKYDNIDKYLNDAYNSAINLTKFI